MVTKKQTADQVSKMVDYMEDILMEGRFPNRESYNWFSRLYYEVAEYSNQLDEEVQDED